MANVLQPSELSFTGEGVVKKSDFLKEVNLKSTIRQWADLTSQESGPISTEALEFFNSNKKYLSEYIKNTPAEE